MRVAFDAHSTAKADASARGAGFRYAQELALILGLILLCLWGLALLSYSPMDPAFSTSGFGFQGTLAGQATEPHVNLDPLAHRPVHNWIGSLGAWSADLSYFLFGYSVWWLLLAWFLQNFQRLLRTWDSQAIASQEPSHRYSPEHRGSLRGAWFWQGLARQKRNGGLLLLMCASAGLEWARLYRWEVTLPGSAGGVLGYLLGSVGQRHLGIGAWVWFCVVLMVPAMAWGLDFSWLRWADGIGRVVDQWWTGQRRRREWREDLKVGERAAQERSLAEAQYKNQGDSLEAMSLDSEWGADADGQVQANSLVVLGAGLTTTQPVQVVLSERVLREKQAALFVDLPVNGLPPIGLLDAAPVNQESVSLDSLEMTSRLIEKKLKDFGVQVRVVAAMPGPVVTRYEIDPAIGVKGSQIVNLAKDLARSLSLVSIRVIETIPGKNYMALELPNARRQSIRLSEILGSEIYHDAKSLLTLGLGKDIVGNPVVADLSKMPHVLVAGTTGSGKSVGINAMILSLLYKAEASDVRLLMIDPKMLEMSVYEGIPHLLAPVVTDMKQAAHSLNWCVAEMEKRYKLMSKVGVRNLLGFNTKIQEAATKGHSIGHPFSLTPENPEPLERLPHIVVVIDELADLMMVVGKKIEELIARLAQKARAAGIHLILATQRPSVDVITGLIKANIPTRIAFQVSSKIDSRTILDQMGAEALLGMGDMLYLPSGTGQSIRVHGAFVSDEEVHRVVAYLKERGGEPHYIDGVLEGGETETEAWGAENSGGEKDPLYDQAVEIVLKDRKASISYVQRKLKIGYNRAARLLEDMETAGLVSTLSSSGQRDILVASRPD